MEKEKQMQELKQILFNDTILRSQVCGECSLRACDRDNKPHCAKYHAIVKVIFGAGYGDTKQAVREFAEKVKPIIDDLVELMFNNNEPNCKVDDCEKPSDIPCGSSICIEENKQVWKSKIDDLLAEVMS